MTTDQIQKAIDAIRECREYEQYASTVSVAASALHKARVMEFNRTLGVLNVMLREAATAAASTSDREYDWTTG